MPTLECILQRFKDCDIRQGFVREVYNQACETGSRAKAFFPESSVEALDNLLVKLYEFHIGERSKEFRGWISLLYGYYNFKASPYEVVMHGRRYHRFAKKLLNTTFATSLPMSDSEALPELSVEAKLNGNVVSFDYMGGLRNSTLTHKLNGFVTSHFFKNDIIRFFSGVAVKKTDDLGSFRFSNQRVNFGLDHALEYVVVFFDSVRKMQLYFDLSGNALFETTTRADVSEQRRLEKAVNIVETNEQFDSVKYSVQFADLLKARWMQNPAQFAGKYSWNYLISGECSVTTAPNGVVHLAHYTRKKNDVRPDENADMLVGDCISYSTVLNVGAEYRNTQIRIVFKGPSVEMYDEAGLVNAHRYDEPLLFHHTSLPEKSSQGSLPVHMMTVSTFSQRKSLKRKILGNLHLIDLPPVLQMYNVRQDDIVHMGYLINPLADSFELLVLDKQDYFTSIPLHLSSFRSINSQNRKVYSA